MGGYKWDDGTGVIGARRFSGYWTLRDSDRVTMAVVAQVDGSTEWSIDLNERKDAYVWEPITFTDLDEAKAYAFTLIRMGG